MSDINRELAELLGDRYSGHSAPDGSFVHTSYRNYASDSGKIELLRLMMKRDDWGDFLGTIGFCRVVTGHGDKIFSDMIHVSYLLDTTGLLAQAAVEWLTAQREPMKLRIP